QGNNAFDAIGIALSPNEKLAMSAGDGRQISLWNVETGERIRIFDRAHAGSIRTVAFSPDGTRAVSASIDRTCRVWDAATGNPWFDSPVTRGRSPRRHS